MKKIVFALAVCIMFMVSCKKDKKDTEKEIQETVSVEVKKIKLKLDPKSDSGVSGNVVFSEENGTVTMTAIMSGLTPGAHAIHYMKKLIVRLMMRLLPEVIGTQLQNLMENGGHQKDITKVILVILRLTRMAMEPSRFQQMSGV